MVVRRLSWKRCMRSIKPRIHPESWAKLCYAEFKNIRIIIVVQDLVQFSLAFDGNAFAYVCMYAKQVFLNLT